MQAIPDQHEAKLTPNRDDAEYNPSGPVRKVFDEGKCHKSTDHDEISLLEVERTLPVDAYHSHNTKVPHKQNKRNVIHRHVVCTQHLPATCNNYTVIRQIITRL